VSAGRSYFPADGRFAADSIVRGGQAGSLLARYRLAAAGWTRFFA
jgi:hypothetical protein